MEVAEVQMGEEAVSSPSQCQVVVDFLVAVVTQVVEEVG